MDWVLPIDAVFYLMDVEEALNLFAVLIGSPFVVSILWKIDPSILSIVPDTSEVQRYKRVVRNIDESRRASVMLRQKEPVD